MIASILHLLKIHRKMILGNTSIVIEDMFGKGPETLDAIYVILGLLADHGFGVIDCEMFAQSFQRIVTAEGVGVVDRAFPRFLSNDRHEFLLGHMLHNPRVDLSIPLQKAKNDVFALSAASALSLAPAAKIALIHFHLSGESLAFKLGNVVDGFAKFLVHTRDSLVVGAKIRGKTVRWLLLIEALHNRNLHANALQRLLFSARFVAASHIPTRGLRNLKRSAENTLFASQKVGRATKNVLSSCNHKGILTPRGYETP